MTHSPAIAVIGGGPAGLMAAEAAVEGGAKVDLYDAMPSVGRKFLLAGKGGLNLTHGEPLERLLERYRERRTGLEPLLRAFGPDELRTWAQGLGVDTFAGSSGRVFPVDMKAAPLLRAWLARLRAAGVRLHARHRWSGWSEEGSGTGALRFVTPRGERTASADATVLALGGGSWPQLGSDGAWAGVLEARGIAVVPLRPSNCGFDIGWSPYFRGRFAGEPVKTVVASFAGSDGRKHRQPGDLIVTDTGIEGGLVYALSAPLRDSIAATGAAVLELDLLPGRSADRLVKELSHPQGRRSMASHMQSRSGLKGVKVGLLREIVPAQDFADPKRLVTAIKSLPLKLVAARPLAEAISTAGGVAFDALDEHLMLRALPGVFCAGEMLDWEAPTGGYLLTACFASGRAAGLGALRWLNATPAA
jgi:uncharacterized flavoprotein (TIGR03862 family)